MKNFTLLALLLFSIGNAQQAGDLVSSELKLDLSATGLISWIDENDQNEIYHGVYEFLDQFPYGMQAYKLTYKSLDYDDNLVNATGLVMFPKTNNKMSNVLFMSPTTDSRENVPSNLKGTYELGIVIPMLMVAAEYIVIAPDYLGMGDGDGELAYIEDKTAAAAGLDMLKASDTFFANLGKQRYDEYFVAGYSQGGHAAMAVNRSNQAQDNLYNIAYVASGAGPYDMSGTMLNDVLLDREEFPNSAFIAYALQTCHNIGFTQFNNDWSEIISDEYIDQFTAAALNGEGGLDWGPEIWRDLFQEDYINALENNMNHPARECLRSNDVHDFYNRTPTMMFSSWNDQTILDVIDEVTLETQRSYYRWWDLGKYKIQKRTLGPWNHTIGAFPYIFAAIFKFNQKRAGGFFNSHATYTGEYPLAFNRNSESQSIDFVRSSIDPHIDASDLTIKGIENNESTKVNDLTQVHDKVALIEVTLENGAQRIIPYLQEEAIALDAKDVLTLNKTQLNLNMKNWPSEIDEIHFIHKNKIALNVDNIKGDKEFQFDVKSLPAFDLIEIIADDAIFTVKAPKIQVEDVKSQIAQNANSAILMAKDKVMQVDVYDLNGQKVLHQLGNMNTEISLALKPGIYIVNVTYPDGSLESIKHIQK